MYAHTNVRAPSHGQVITDGALCILHFKGIQKSVFRSLLFVVAVRLAVVPFSTQHWFAVICLMFVGFNVCVAKDASQAVFPMQSPSDVVLGIIRRCATMAEPSGAVVPPPTPPVPRPPALVLVLRSVGEVPFGDLTAFQGLCVLHGMAGCVHTHLGMLHNNCRFWLVSQG